MVITLIKNNAVLVLCDGAVRGENVSSGPSGMTYTGQEQRQIAQFLRAKSARVYPRGNGLEQFAFSVKRQCSSVEAAYAWLFAHRLEIPKDDDPDNPLYVEFVQGSEAWRLEHADVNIVGARFMGLTIQVDYDIIGGPLTTGTVGTTGTTI